MSKFKVGDRVKVVSPGSRYHGYECTVSSALTPAKNPSGHGRTIKRGDLVHWLDIPPQCGGICVIAKPEHLVPIYDGNEKVSWSECVWQPNKAGA